MGDLTVAGRERGESRMRDCLMWIDGISDVIGRPIIDPSHH